MSRPDHAATPATDLDTWEVRLRELCDRIRTGARDAMGSALERGALSDVDRPVAQGAGDVTYGLDLPTEEVLSSWLSECARSGNGVHDSMTAETDAME